VVNEVQLIVIKKKLGVDSFKFKKLLQLITYLFEHSK